MKAIGVGRLVDAQYESAADQVHLGLERQNSVYKSTQSSWYLSLRLHHLATGGSVDGDRRPPGSRHPKGPADHLRLPSRVVCRRVPLLEEQVAGLM